MTPFYTDDWLTLYGGDCRTVLASLPADSVDCVVTSPPYWGLRDYGNDGQLGLERTPEEYVANMVAVFREVRRVLKPSGTCWLNLGDSYNASPRGNTAGDYSTSSLTNPQRQDAMRRAYETAGSSDGAVGRAPRTDRRGRGLIPSLKPKDLVGIPWRVAFALQADGWYLRSDIIWSKPNPMPESVTDRPTKAHEYLFLLTKSPRYYFDADAVREPHWHQKPENAKQYGAQIAQHLRRPPTMRGGGDTASAKSGRGYQDDRLNENPAGRNIRSVWNIATRPYPGAHFAVFPPELPERCIRAGSSEKGVCPECEAPWKRVVQATRVSHAHPPGRGERKVQIQQGGKATSMFRTGLVPHHETTGWQPTCACVVSGHSITAPIPVPAVILDPFAGSGTVGMVANRLSRRAILIDLNPAYLVQQMKRNAQTPLGLTEGDAA